MTNEDAEELARLVPHLDGIGSVGILSPRDIERRIFPHATALPRWRWDLDRPGTRRFDLLIASNVFMYAADPARWFRDVLASCRYFLLLDLVRRRRSSEGELGRDRDRMRYGVGGERPRGEPAFDLTGLGERLLAHRTFHGGANEFDREPLHVIALFRGDLADATLRIDDYPTGVRPILEDLSPLHEILTKVESRGIRYYLGIVPALLSDEMVRFLGGLEHVIHAVHGYDHANPRYAPLLEAKGDPFNERTLGAVDEFQGQPYDVVLERLSRGRRLLEDRLGNPVETYIPPGNLGDRRTGRALVEAGFRRYLSEKRIAGCPLPWIRSNFYGTSDRYERNGRFGVHTLHLTWEWDLVRRGETRSLDRMLDHLADLARAERALGARLTAAVANGTPEGRAAVSEARAGRPARRGRADGSTARPPRDESGLD